MASVGLVFGLHLHQPIGNFDHVFRTHVDDVYRPILAALDRHDVVLGPTEEIFVAGDGTVLDPGISFGTTQVTVIPEPGRAVLALLGFVSVLMRRRR